MDNSYLKTIYQLLFFFLVFFCFTPSIFAQETPDEEVYVSVKMLDGNKFFGKRIALTDTHLVIETSSIGKLNLELRNIKSIKEIGAPKIVEGEYWYETPNSTRNLFTPTGYSLEKGDAYYQNLMLVYNQFSYGFSDRFTVGVGFEIISLLVGSNSPLFTITPKYSIPLKENQWNLGVGALIVGVPSTENFIDLGTLYATNTFGSKDTNLSIGLGFGITDGSFSERPILNISGNARVSKRFGLLTENWILPFDGSSAGVFSFGIRIIGERMTWDFAFLGLSDSSDFNISPIPLVGILAQIGD